LQELAAVQRQFLNFPVLHNLADSRVFQLQQRYATGYSNRFSYRANLQTRGYGSHLVHLQFDPVERSLLEPLARHGDIVNPRLQSRDTKLAAGVGKRRPYGIGLNAPDLDRGVRYGS